jgi:hypothetical protein
MASLVAWLDGVVGGEAEGVEVAGDGWAEQPDRVVGLIRSVVTETGASSRPITARGAGWR